MDIITYGLNIWNSEEGQLVVYIAMKLTIHRMIDDDFGDKSYTVSSRTTE